MEKVKRSLKLLKASAQLVANVNKSRREKALQLPRKCMELPPEVQCIIVAGQTGKAVKVKTSELPVVSEDGDPFPGKHPPTFEFDEDQIKNEEKEADLSPFVAPNARLLRGMRRCDRKLLPSLEEWTAVDAVVTKYELVCFDAVDSSNTGSDDDKQAVVGHALIATKGGKGLRLRDVAWGRKVVGQLSLLDASAVCAERMLPNHVEEPTEEETVHQMECWRQEDHLTGRSIGWSQVTEDRLKIESDIGTLHLRFFGDLADRRAHPERCASECDESGPLFGNNSFQWAQTIVRIRGEDELSQELPHFGENTSDELRDCLQIFKSRKWHWRCMLCGLLPCTHGKSKACSGSSVSAGQLPQKASVEVPSATEAAFDSAPVREAKHARDGHSASVTSSASA